MDKRNILSFQEKILAWYDAHKRALPWRLEEPNPYYTWVSEIMLQQTTVPTVIPYFQRFLIKWPSVFDLAAASLDDVLHLWQGLGYYSRARNLHRCAQTLVQEYDGIFPNTEQDLKKLPGIGEYTAAAICAIALDQPAAVVDGNIERILSRLFLVETPLPQSKTLLKKHAQKLTPQRRPGDYAQALMDLGSKICTPTNPRCIECPAVSFCKATHKNPEIYPKKQPKKEKPRKEAFVFWIENERGEILLEKRPEKGLLGGLMGFPSSPWEEIELTKEKLSHAPLTALWKKSDRSVTHTFTHFHLTLTLMKGRVQNVTDGLWVNTKNFGDYALPTLMKKVVKAALE